MTCEKTGFRFFRYNSCHECVRFDISSVGLSALFAFKLCKPPRPDEAMLVLLATLNRQGSDGCCHSQINKSYGKANQSLHAFVPHREMPPTRKCVSPIENTSGMNLPALSRSCRFFA